MLAENYTRNECERLKIHSKRVGMINHLANLPGHITDVEVMSLWECGTVANFNTRLECILIFYARLECILIFYTRFRSSTPERSQFQAAKAFVVGTPPTLK
jgi:hypothetical protein